MPALAPLCDTLQDLSDLECSIYDESKASNSHVNALDCSCFNGEYITELKSGYFAELERTRTSDRGGPMSSNNLLDTLQASDRSPPLPPPPQLSSPPPSLSSRSPKEGGPNRPRGGGIPLRPTPRP